MGCDDYHDYQLIATDSQPIPAPITSDQQHHAALAIARANLAIADTLPPLEKLPVLVQLADGAEAMRGVVTRAKLSLDAQNDWAEYKLDAIRKGGQLLIEMERQGDGRPKSKPFNAEMVLPTLKQLGFETPNGGVDRAEAHRWRLGGSLSHDEYRDYIDGARHARSEITFADILRIAKRLDREDELDRRAKDIAALAPETALITTASFADWLPTQPDYDLLLTDPPYSTDVDNIETFVATWLPPALAKIKPTGRAYICIGSYPAELRAYLNAPTPNHLILDDVLGWTYRNTIGPSPAYGYKRNWQAILYYRGIDAPRIDCPELIEQFSMQDIGAPTAPTTGKWHTWQKPDTLGERFIRHSTQPGDLIVDPFAGSGTFLLAAARLARKASGCEINPEHVAAAIERGCQHG